MTKELRAMLEQLETMKGEVRSFMAQDKVDDAEKRMNDVRSLQKKIELQRSLEEGEERDYKPGRGLDDPQERRSDEELETEYQNVFLKGLRRRSISSEERSIIREYEQRAVMHEGGATGQVDGDAGLIVPKDIQTSINKVMRSFNDLSQYVNVQNVNTLSGSRVLEKNEDMTPFQLVEEYGIIPDMDNPKFQNISYAVKKRAGILPITNELLADTDQNIIAYITDWIGRKAVVTRNLLVTGMLDTFTKTAFADLDAVRRAVNISLDPAIAASSVILTNQDGYDWLDGQKDANGRYLLQDDITQPGRKLYKGLPIIVAANRYLPTVTNKAPFIVGDLKQGVVLFSRKFFELASTKEGGDAWKRDTTDLRTIMRDDIKIWDPGAVVYGQIDIAPTV
ncbi:capsid protein [Paenibacillus sp. SSG-1]|uniref:phage major capsid protein n=1 Tax=Paenibacillus sp. SSG-1 TaxID=1443669 RepID=UPI000B7E6CC8|nr:phage major capsid protein [Paenibacillus sp. SSG-1]OXL83173.1 capsid protein [Paenibacillus sp. SSG-1]